MMLVALAILLLIASVGAAVDSARAHMLRSRLSTALDAAGLAGGAVVNSQNVQADVERFFRANFPEGYMNARLEGPEVEISANNKILTLSASAEIDTLFMGVVGINTLDVSVSSEITRESRGMELVMVLDNTGSMTTNNRIGMLRTAATDLVNILYGSNETIENFWVGMVPYAATVNIGSHRTDWLTGYNAALYSPTTWKGCVEARTHPQDITDDPPDVGGRWTPFRYASASDNVWPPVDERTSRGNDATGPNIGCPPPILPLMDRKSVVQAAVNALEAGTRGGTLANLGLVWGWRVISPRWRGLWEVPDARLLLVYRTPLMDKVVILLTDGVNEFYDHPPAGPSGSDYTAYGRVGEGRLGTTNRANATTEANRRFSEICQDMKDEGIILYTITFELGNTTTQNLYRTCASNPAYYFNSPNGTDLQQVFRTIADSLGNLRVSR